MYWTISKNYRLHPHGGTRLIPTSMTGENEATFNGPTGQDSGEPITYSHQASKPAGLPAASSSHLTRQWKKKKASVQFQLDCIPTESSARNSKCPAYTWHEKLGKHHQKQSSVQQWTRGGSGREAEPRPPDVSGPSKLRI